MRDNIYNYDYLKYQTSEQKMLDKSAGKAVKARIQAERYVSKVLRDLRQLAKLAHHEFTEPEIRQILNALHEEIEKLEVAFAPKPKENPAQPEFKFQ